MVDKVNFSTTPILSKSTQELIYGTNISDEGIYSTPDDLSLETLKKLKSIYYNNGKIRQAIDLPVVEAIGRIQEYVHPDEKVRDFISDYVLSKIDISKILQGILTSRWVGISVSLVETEVIDNFLTIKDMYTFDPERYWGGVGDKVIKLSDIDKEIPRKNCVVHTYGARFNNAYGNSLLKYISKQYDSKQEVEKAWKLFLRKYAIPMIWGYIPENSTTEQRKKMLDELTNLSYASVGVISTKQTSGSRQQVEQVNISETTKGTADFENYITKYDRDIIIGLGVPPLLFEPTERGTYALGAIQLKIFIMTVKEIESIINQVTCGTIFRELIRVNFGIDNGGYFVFQDLEGREFKEVVNGLTNLIQSGSLDPDEPQIRDILGLKRKDGTYKKPFVDKGEVKPTKSTEKPVGNLK